MAAAPAHQPGTTFIKLGQLLSARPDVLPPDYVAQLSRLQDQVPSFPFSLARQMLREELGERLDQLVFIEETPLGSASLAQVHGARLGDGRAVVLKLQRPNLEKLFRLDLEVMQQVARLLQRHPVGVGAGIGPPWRRNASGVAARTGFWPGSRVCRPFPAAIRG